ncbi:hypothetical protein AYM39_07145 [Methylomonas sp. DH-1]|nr:hypothetical protein AYM39_07145 [Methylomonas sp. DH-1]
MVNNLIFSVFMLTILKAQIWLGASKIKILVDLILVEKALLLRALKMFNQFQFITIILVLLSI